ncbi:P-II family nitrogen regulator [Fodinibius halophilus]|uniref:P-II family nitrogen regulator n=1 Tax=Fodinibius halophilus TaxID=1736908 RepID=A0A6M1T3P6_9BACT|nr:P-II family nitrogen regulator [Fodinibius halophilus]NGP90046.1 P-II family nitrogen regulator [Fodinibius halophilus]
MIVCAGIDQFIILNDQRRYLNFPAMHSLVAKIEIAVESNDVATVIDIIKKHGETGHKGAGMLFFYPIERVTGIRYDKRVLLVLK